MKLTVHCLINFIYFVSAINFTDNDVIILSLWILSIYLYPCGYPLDYPGILAAVAVRSDGSVCLWSSADLLAAASAEEVKVLPNTDRFNLSVPFSFSDWFYVVFLPCTRCRCTN